MSFHIYQAKLELSLIVINTSEVTFPIVLPNEKQKYNWKVKKCSKLDFFFWYRIQVAMPTSSTKFRGYS